MRVAVVGGGAAAVSLLDRLLSHGDRLGDDVAVDLYEPAAIGHGVAFGPDLECARINLPNARMSVRYGDPAHFHAWLQARPGVDYLPDDIAAADGYAPRHVYGRYLVEHLRACRAEAAARGWRTTVHAETVVDVLPAPHATTVVTSTARRDHTHVVLGTGSGSPADPFALRGSPGFHPDPYPLRTVLPAIGPHDDVLVLGTGLTAVDVTLGLLHLGHQGRITMASRRGILPGLRAPGWPGPLTRITAAAVADLAARPHPARPHDILDLLGLELRDAGWEPAAERHPAGRGKRPGRGHRRGRAGAALGRATARPGLPAARHLAGDPWRAHCRRGARRPGRAHRRRTAGLRGGLEPVLRVRPARAPR